MRRAGLSIGPLAGLFVLGGTMAWAEDWFGPPVVSEAGGIDWVELADLNEDGRLDLVGQDSDGWSVYLGEPGGHFVFQQRMDYPIQGPDSFTIIDDNGDGHLDLILEVNGTQPVRRWWNDGAANFTYYGNTNVVGGPWTVEDLNDVA